MGVSRPSKPKAAWREDGRTLSAPVSTNFLSFCFHQNSPFICQMFNHPKPLRTTKLRVNIFCAHLETFCKILFLYQEHRSIFL